MVNIKHPQVHSQVMHETPNSKLCLMFSIWVVSALPVSHSLRRQTATSVIASKLAQPQYNWQRWCEPLE